MSMGDFHMVGDITLGMYSLFGLFLLALEHRLRTGGLWRWLGVKVRRQWWKAKAMVGAALARFVDAHRPVNVPSAWTETPEHPGYTITWTTASGETVPPQPPKPARRPRRKRRPQS